MKMNWIAALWTALLMVSCQTEYIPRPKTATNEPDGYVNHPKHAVYQKAIEDYNRKWRLPGTVVLLKKAEEPLWIGAVGTANLEHGTAIRVTDSFRTGSITKAFVSTVMMKLKEQGLLKLDDTLESLLPEVKGQIPDARLITIRHLLAHTSGIFDPTNDDLQYQLDLINNPQRRIAMSADEVLKRYVYKRPLVFAPGDRYSYSNPNYWLLGKIIEQKTGKRLEEVFSDYIFRPAGLTRSYVEARAERDVVRGYNDFYGNGRLMDVTAMDRADSEGQASGGLISTAEDLYKFGEALFEGKLISLASVREMTTPQPVRQGTNSSGLGLDSYETPLGTAWGKNGTLLGADANWFYFPEQKATYVIFNNYGAGSDKSFVEKLLK